MLDAARRRRSSAALHGGVGRCPSRSRSDDATRGPESQGALGARDAVDARVELDGCAQGAGEGLELGLDDVVRVAARRAPARAGDAGG